MKAKFKIPMRFQDGDGGRKMCPQFSGKTCIDLVIEGHRTATSRDASKWYNKYDLQVGDIVLFYSGSKSVLVRITKAPYKINLISKEEWSQLECWDSSVYERLNNKYQQYQFELIK